MYSMTEKRDKFVSYLQQHEHNSKMSLNEQNKILDWVQSKIIPS